MSWSSKALEVMKKLQNTEGFSNYIPFVVEERTYGMVHLENLCHFQDSEYFSVSSENIQFQDNLQTVSDRSSALHNFFFKLKNEGRCLNTLGGWRNETYSVFERSFGSELLFDVERAAVPILGCKSYGVHLNGYIKVDGEYKIWAGVRAQHKAKYPGMYDNIVAGGISSGYGIWDTLVKEADEEANMSPEIIARAQPAGCLSYTITNQYGTSPEVEFVYDLELPLDFIPDNNDNEMDQFQLLSVEDMKEAVVGENFKTNCAAIVIDFLFRHGLVKPDETPDYVEIINLLHSNHLF